jgi:Tol biopolymer transport system component
MHGPILGGWLERIGRTGQAPARCVLLALSLAGFLVTCGDRAPPPPQSSALAEERGSWLVYEKDLEANLDIWLVPVQGGPERRLTADAAKDAMPRWMPDGRSVLFSSDRTGVWQLWEVSREGGEPRRVRTSPRLEWQADVSTDGRRLAFLTDVDGNPALWIADRSSGQARELLRHRGPDILGNPHWSPDGRQVVVSSNWEVKAHKIYVVDAATGTERRVSPDDWGACEPRFSPDGRRVAYVRRRRATRERSAIVESDLVTGRDRTLVDWPALNYDPVYSPDGSELAFASTIGGEFAIYRMRLADGKSWRVTFGPGAARHPDYEPRVSVNAR